MKPNDISRLEFLIVFSLQKCEATSPIKAVTINELQGYCPTKQSYSTFYRAIKYLCKNNYIVHGLKDGKNDTYYLNQKGIDLIKGCC
jgi:DNA-binding PadR family transcriptional regulator